MIDWLVGRNVMCGQVISLKGMIKYLLQGHIGADFVTPCTFPISVMKNVHCVSSIC